MVARYCSTDTLNAYFFLALHPRSTLPPPRRFGLRFPTPVGHGRGLAPRPGCACPGEGIDSARRRLHRFRRVSSPRPSRFRLRLRSSMPEAQLFPIVSAHYSASTGPASFLANPNHASAIRKSSNVQREAATAPETSGGGRYRRAFNLCFPVERPWPGWFRRLSR